MQFETILLVDDDDGVRAFSRYVLASSGYAILEASDGRNALLLAQNHEGTIDLLVTDLEMPHLEGCQLAEQLEAIRPDLKVLFISGHSEKSAIQEGLLRTGAAFLEKPFSPIDLAQKVREILHKVD